MFNKIHDLKSKDNLGTTCSATLLFAALAGIKVFQQLQWNPYLYAKESRRSLQPGGKFFSSLMLQDV